MRSVAILNLRRLVAPGAILAIFSHGLRRRRSLLDLVVFLGRAGVFFGPCRFRLW